MASNLSSIGMSADSDEEYFELADRAADSAERIPCKGGRYLHWSCDEGAELWVQVDDRNNFLGLLPSFSGKSRLNMGLMEFVSRPDDTALDGMIFGVSNPPEGEPVTGETDGSPETFPIVFELVDRALYGKLDFPFVSPVRLTAFAHELSAYASPEAFLSEQSSETRSTVQSFMPTGLFDPGGRPAESPRSEVMFSGNIRRVEELQNSLTNEFFFHAVVDVLGGTVDVVVDPDIVKGTMVEGGVIFGSFYLNGRILAPVVKKKWSLSRLFNR